MDMDTGVSASMGVDAGDKLRGLQRDHYGTILMDAPWAFLTYSGRSTTPHRSAEDHYDTMTLDELRALPVKSIAAKNAALWMWTVDSHLDVALALGKHYGFTFKTIALIWLKSGMYDAQFSLLTGDLPDPTISMGYWTRKQAEICLLFTRGKPRRLSKSVRQVIVDRRREHSRKPDEQYARIEALTAGPYAEIFARQQRPGWDVWGNQTQKFEAAA